MCVLDNAKYHHAHIIYQFLEIHCDNLWLEFLPPYSPKLNPIERVWKLTLTRRLCMQTNISLLWRTWLNRLPNKYPLEQTKCYLV
ncbi:MAG: transposase [Candidatus Brocadia sp.]|nr:transposase [Candidatus Brocadia sp.]